MPSEFEVLEQNLELNRLEYRSQRGYLRSRPRVLGLVLGNACNIDCPHCYQAKNQDNLLKPPEIGAELRREFAALYPFLSTLRIQGGEAFAYRGFREILDDVSSVVTRPLVSVSTNGTLIDESWAERIVRMPFSNLTVSLDGGTRETYNRLRRGADFDEVLANVRRVQRWKDKLQSPYPALDSFFVILRSNFREIPQYLAVAADHGFCDLTLQTAELTAENLSRHPGLAADEIISSREEAEELHTLLCRVLPAARRQFRMVRVSGLQTLFERFGLPSAFLDEQENGLYPDAETLAGPASELPAGDAPEPRAFELCPNPWTTLFVAENGDVHLCFLAAPTGNLYRQSLLDIWNSPQAVTKRVDMMAGRYMASGCSPLWCSWREGQRLQPPPPSDPPAAPVLLPILNHPAGPHISAVRRTASELTRRVAELEALQQLHTGLQSAAQQHIDHLEAKVAKALADIAHLQQENALLEDQVQQQALRCLALSQALAAVPSRPKLRARLLTAVATRLAPRPTPPPPA